MFQFSIKKEDLLASLLTIAGAVDKKNSLAILSNFLLRVNGNCLFLTATDLEIEISVQVVCDSNGSSGSITVPAKKIIDIIKSLDENTIPTVICDQNLLTIKQNRSSFKLATLPADTFPVTEEECNEVEMNLPRIVLLQLLQSTHFALSQQDVRVFLNGLFIEFTPKLITAVATDGHRMAINRYECLNESQKSLLLPKKGVQELLRLLTCIPDETVLLTSGKSHFKLISSQFIFLSKLIEARFPPYVKAIPKNQDKHILIDCLVLKRALTRIVILAHEKSKAVLLHMQQDQLTLIANNNDKEEAIETLIAQTQGDEFKIGLNASYLLDVLSHFGEGLIRLSMSTTESSVLIENSNNDKYQYIIMPMKI
ncbi:MAG: DNA polymerase III subunit beta [Legionella sp.]|nr:DNA polymerase III subunit beta [Legionella sp.]